MKKILLAIFVTFFMLAQGVSADYTENIDDNIELYTALQQLNTFIETSETPNAVRAELTAKVKHMITENFGEFDDKIETLNIFKNDEFSSKKEYILYNIYKSLYKEGLLDFYYDAPRVLENEYVRVLVFSDDIEIDESSLFVTERMEPMMEFYDISEERDTKDFIEKNIWKHEEHTEVKKVDTEAFSFTNGESYVITYKNFSHNTDYSFLEKTSLFPYIAGYANSRFHRVSDELLIFSNYGPDVQGIEYDTIEFKK